MRKILAPLILLLLFCGAAESGSGEVFVNQTVWATTNQPVQICELPPYHGEIVTCTAIPPLFCEKVGGHTFIMLDPSGMPPYTEMYQFVTYTVENESYSQLVNITVYRLAPVRSSNVNQSVINRTDMKSKIDKVMSADIFYIMMMGFLAIAYINRRTLLR